MKRNIMYSMLPILFWIFGAMLNAQAPVVFNVEASQRTDGSKIIDIYYDLNFMDSCTVSLALSSNGGIDFNLIPTRSLLYGDIGNGVMPGENKHIEWDAGLENYILDGTSYLFRVIATGTYNVDSNFVYIPAGEIFVDGNYYTLSDYYVSKYEVTQGSYEYVMRENPSHGYNTGPDFPVYNVDWYKAIEYCNRRSALEGFTPCYSYEAYGTDVDDWPVGWNLQNSNHTLIQCNWDVNGYRLLSELEWLYAGRGGASSLGYTYSGSNILDDVAWYDQNSYLMPPGHSDHGVHPVGNKAPNELGLFDMTGNVYEWCWDIYSTGSYGSYTNPHGANTGTHRSVKGAGWQSDNYGCLLRIRCIGLPMHSADGDFGIRLGRTGSLTN